VLIYNIQEPTGTNIETATMKRLSRLPNIVGVKEPRAISIRSATSCRRCRPLILIFRCQRRRRRDPAAYGLGGRGVVSVVSNLVPAKIVALVKAALSGSFAEARNSTLNCCLSSRPPLSSPTRSRLSGHGALRNAAGGYRLPLCELQPENREKLKGVLKSLNLLK